MRQMQNKLGIIWICSSLCLSLCPSLCLKCCPRVLWRHLKLILGLSDRCLGDASLIIHAHPTHTLAVTEYSEEEALGCY